MSDTETKIVYYPGCTLSTKAKNYDGSGRAVAAALGMELEELPEWQCCGATFPLMLDDSMALIAPTRILYQAQQAGERVATLCAICFNVLRRSQALLKRDPEMLERINWFTEQEYHGEVHVAHFLEILRDDLGWEALAERVVRPLTGLRVADHVCRALTLQVYTPPHAPSEYAAAFSGRARSCGAG